MRDSRTSETQQDVRETHFVWRSGFRACRMLMCIRLPWSTASSHYRLVQSCTRTHLLPVNTGCPFEVVSLSWWHVSGPKGKKKNTTHTYKLFTALKPYTVKQNDCKTTWLINLVLFSEQTPETNLDEQNRRDVARSDREAPTKHRAVFNTHRRLIALELEFVLWGYCATKLYGTNGADQQVLYSLTMCSGCAAYLLNV